MTSGPCGCEAYECRFCGAHVAVDPETGMPHHLVVMEDDGTYMTWAPACPDCWVTLAVQELVASYEAWASTHRHVEGPHAAG